MRSVSVRHPLAAVLLLAPAVPAGAGGQEVGASAVVLAARHDLLPSPLAGAAAALRWGPVGGVVAYHVGAEGLGGRAERTGIPCAGLIRPGTCAPERVRDDARLYGADAGAAVRVLGGRRATLALTGDLTAGVVGVDTRGLASGNALYARKWLWGWWAGVEARWAPAPRVPLALETGAAVGGLAPFVTEQISDGYTPFNDGFGVTRFHVGLAWRGAAARRSPRAGRRARGLTNR